MKRSEINRILTEAKEFFSDNKFALPPWAYWSPEDWKTRGAGAEEIFRNMLGWDITDFGSGNYRSRGLFLFTLRNGNLKLDKKPYAEKIMIVGVDQETPMHFHFHKMEDIIVRGGGKLAVELYASTPDGALSDRPLEVSVDGIRRRVDAGSIVLLGTGESICLEQGMYHRFWAQEATALVGEVSMTNDDLTDNRFLEPVGRFPEIEEDEAPLHLLVSDYGRAAARDGSGR